MGLIKKMHVNITENGAEKEAHRQTISHAIKITIKYE